MKNYLPTLIFVVGALVFSTNANAQQTFENFPQFTVGIGYFGELLTHPGVVIFGEYGLNKAQNQYLVRLNLAYYRHKNHTQNYLLLPELIYRRNTQKLNYWEASLGLGGLFQKADRPVYAFDQGAFNIEKSGWIYFVPSLGIRYGNSFQLKNGKSLIPSLGGRIYYQYPFNSQWLLRTAFDLSLAYQIK